MTGGRLTRKQKESNDFQWYKDNINNFCRRTENYIFDFLEDETFVGNDKHRMKSNYDLFNNKVNMKDFEAVCYPFGKDSGKPKTNFTHKDIVSGKIKALIGMEMRRPFSFRVLATNPEATTRKEQEEFNQIRDFVIQEITAPIRKQVEQEQAQQLAQQNQEEPLTEEQISQINSQVQQQIEQEVKARTPQEVKLYMERDHQDPAELLAHQILEYLKEKEDIRNKFNLAWKHGLLSSKEIFRACIENREPVLKVINPLYFDCGEFDYNVEDAEWASYDEFLTVSEIVNRFGDVLENEDIDNLYKKVQNRGTELYLQDVFSDNRSSDRIRVTHCEWKSLKPIKFVRGIDLETNEPYEIVVDEEYKLNKESGDLSEELIWVVSRYEGYKIDNDLYLHLREVPGQYFDLENPTKCKLSYIGCYYDALNSEPTSIMDRIKHYNYLYDTILYRIESLINSDRGKILGINASLIPLKSAKISLDQWFYYTFDNQIALLNPNEEGTRQSEITQAVKEIDLSLISDIKKYVELADYIERRCGESVGITKQIEGQIGSNEAVRNTQQAIIQSANILEPYFEMHNIVKRNALQALIEIAKVAYSTYQPKYLSYALDDFSQRMLQIDYDLLENSTYGIFVSNSMKSDEALQMVRQLAHAAMQNQAIEMSDVMKVMRSESITEAEELLKKAEKERREFTQQQQEEQLKSQKELQEAQQQHEKDMKYIDHQFKMEEIDLKGKLEIQKQTILSIGFNEDKDLDKDGTPDVLEVAKFGIDADIKQRNIELQEAKLEQQKKEHEDNMKQQDKKLAIDEKKAKNQVLKSSVNVE